MRRHPNAIRPVIVGAIGAIGLVVSLAVVAVGVAVAGDGSLSPELQSVRVAVARYHSFQQAEREGYRIRAGEPCVEAPLGTMGVHALNAALMADDAIDPARPEILLYLPWAAAMAFLPLSASGRLSAPAQVLSTFRMLVVASLASIVLAVLVGPPLLPLIFGGEFEASVTPFLLLVPAPIGYSAIWLFSNALLAASSPGRASVGPFSSLVIGLTLAAVLIPIWEAEGAALAATLGYLVGGIVSAAAYRRTSRVRVVDFVPRPADARSLVALIRHRPAET